MTAWSSLDVVALEVGQMFPSLRGTNVQVHTESAGDCVICGRLIGVHFCYFFWEALGYLKDIALEGDMVRNYAQHYLDISAGFGCSNAQFMDSYVTLTRELSVDAVIFNQVFGCRDMTASYRYFKDHVTRELDIPVTMVNFNRIGEGLEQVKTRVQALMEML